MIQINQTLYKQTKTGAIQQWSVFVDGSTIIVEQGQVGGALQQYQTVCEARNVGKANATTPEEQSVLEANSKWSKQVKKGYTIDKSGSVTVKLPMKVKVYQDNIPNVIFPCSASPKLDGVNGTWVLTEGNTLKLKSRGGDDYPLLEHQVDEVKLLMQQLNTCVLNGEVYKHNTHLQDITSAVKKPNELTPKLEFWVFELPEIPLKWKDKEGILKVKHMSNADREFVKVVPSYTFTSHEELEQYHKTCVNAGYEGIIIRNYDCVYEYNIRSSNAFKFKEQMDEEFKVVGFKKDKNNHVVYTCVTEKGLEFEVKPKGTNEERKQLTEAAEMAVGMWLKVAFEQFSKDGKPLKPVGIGLRLCDSKGKPLE